MQRRVRDDRGKTIYERDGIGAVVSNGAKKGVPLSDVWEIPCLNPKAKERVGYPTQKPVLLLERIIELVTDPKDLVLDPFCGSGTTLVAAKLLGRRWLGMDSSRDAVEISLARLEKPSKTTSLLLQKGRSAYLNNDERVKAMMFGINYVRVHRNNGIDCILKKDFEGKAVLVRIQRDDETIYDAAAALKKAARGKGGVVLIVISTVAGMTDLVGTVPAIDGVHVVTGTAHAIEKMLVRLHPIEPLKRSRKDPVQPICQEDLLREKHGLSTLR